MRIQNKRELAAALVGSDASVAAQRAPEITQEAFLRLCSSRVARTQSAKLRLAHMVARTPMRWHPEVIASAEVWVDAHQIWPAEDGGKR